MIVFSLYDFNSVPLSNFLTKGQLYSVNNFQFILRTGMEIYSV